MVHQILFLSCAVEWFATWDVRCTRKQFSFKGGIEAG